MLRISTYLSYDISEDTYEDLHCKSYYDKVKFIGDNGGLWNKISVWDEAIKYFNGDEVHAVRYSSYLINHTKKLAVDMKDYFMRSLYLTRKGNITTIDALPILTETGKGAEMALFDGVSLETTEELAGTWCGDLWYNI